jgi:outer membrane biosynthesis protein TonB
MDLETNPYAVDAKGAQPHQSTAASQQPEQKAPLRQQQEPITAAEQFALLTQKSAAALERPTTASQPQSAYRRMKEKTHMVGNITNRGVSAVNALGTPLGRYEKIVIDAIGSRWYAFVDGKRDLASIGTLRVDFNVDRSGKVKGLKITENSSNEAFANLCIQSVMEAQLPPIPEDVASALPAEGLPMEGLSFSIIPR